MLAKVVVVAALCAAIISAQSVKDVTDATFDEVVNSHDFVLMEFYAPWCGHCKKLEPEYESAAAQIGDAALLAKLDATAEQASGQKFGIKGFPTIKVFRGGKLAGDYEGGRSAADFVKYVKGNSGPAVKPVADAAALEELKKTSDPLYVLYASDAASEASKAFEAAAKGLRSLFTFASVADASVSGFAEGKIQVFKSFDEKEGTLEGEVTADSVTEFCKGHGVKSFDEIGPDNYKMYLERGLPMGWLFTTADENPQKAAVAAIASKHKSKLSFVWIDSAKYAGMAQRLGLSGNKFPAFVFDHEGAHFAFPEESDITEEALAKFTEDYLAGTLTKTVRSEALPAEHTVDGLTTLVGHNFDDLVSNAEQDVLVEFYAPWCGHCKQLAPVYAKVAKALESQPVRIAQIDATANDYDQKKFPVQGFPTLFFVPKGGEPQPFESDRSYEGIIKFLKDKATTPITVDEAKEDL